MPRPGPRRPYVAVRLDPDALAWVDAEAVRQGVTRSDVLREAVTVLRRKRGG